MHGLFDFKKVTITLKIKIKEKPTSFAARHLIFQFQQEVLKFNDIC